MACLPFERAELVDPFGALEARSRRMANVVDAISRRRDVRRFRAQLLLLILRLACPRGATPRRAWYVPGACARLGAAGLRRAWEAFHGEHPPTLRTFRSHLRELERACAVTCSPGDWIPVRPDPAHPERRPRYPDTIHVLETDDEADYWARDGAAVLEAEPAARHNPTRWRELFAAWRERARLGGGALQRLLPFEEHVEGRPGEDARHTPPTASPDPRPSSPNAGPPSTGRQGGPQPIGAALEVLGVVAPAPPRAAAAELEGPASRSRAARALAELVAREAGPFELLDALRASGAALAGRNASRMLADAPRLRASAALYAVALVRGDRIRNRAAWVWRAWRFASPAELCRALAWAGRANERESPCPPERETAAPTAHRPRE